MNGNNLQHGCGCCNHCKQMEEEKNYEKLLHLFSTKSFRSTSGRDKLKINVGERVPDGFQSYLQSVHREFDIRISNYKNHTQLLFKNLSDRTSNVTSVVTLSLISNLSVKCLEDDLIPFCQYEIYFTYADIIDYRIEITTWKENA